MDGPEVRSATLVARTHGGAKAENARGDRIREQDGASDMGDVDED